jgi:hypothetical protein
VHAGLAVASFIPVVGTAASLVDAGIYAYQGDYVGAAISLAGAIPVVGEGADALKAGRLAMEGVKAAEETSQVVRVGEEASHVVQATDEGAQALKAGDQAASGDQSLFRFDANNPKYQRPDGPPDVRPNVDIKVKSKGPDAGLVKAQDPAGGDVQGASTFAVDDPAAVGLKGRYWSIPRDYTLPDGLGLHADGADVGGTAPWGHRTIYPTRDMPYDEFNGLVQALPWMLTGTIPP